MVMEVLEMAESDYVREGYIWIMEATKKHKRSRSWLYPLVASGRIRSERYTGDPKLYICEEDLVKIIRQPRPRETRKTKTEE